MGMYRAIEIIANPNPIIRNAENRYPMTSRMKVTLFKSNLIMCVTIITIIRVWLKVCYITSCENEVKDKLIIHSHDTSVFIEHFSLMYYFTLSERWFCDEFLWGELSHLELEFYKLFDLIASRNYLEYSNYLFLSPIPLMFMGSSDPLVNISAMTKRKISLEFIYSE